MKAAIIGLLTALVSIAGVLIACVAVGLIVGLICRGCYLGWQAAWAVFT